MQEKRHIDLRDRFSARKRRSLRKKRAVLINQIVPREHQIGGRFPRPRIAVYVSADIFSGLCRHERFPILSFADHFVACRQICDHSGACARMADGRRTAYPKILADLARDTDFRMHGVAKEQFAGKRNADAFRQRYRTDPFRRRRKMALFIELGIIGEMRFRNDPFDFAVAKRRRTIEQFSAEKKREPDKHEHPFPDRCRRHVKKRFQAPVCKHFLQKQIAAGISAERQLRKDQQLRSLFRLPPDDFDHARSVVSRIGDAQLRAHRRRPQKTVFHAFFPPDQSFSSDFSSFALL